MKTFFAAAIALASSIQATAVPEFAKRDISAVPLVYLPVSICAAILGEATCKAEENGKGLVAVPVDTCLAVLGLAKCSEDCVPAKGSKPKDPETLVSVPITVCAAVLGKAYCDQHEKSDGLISIPIGICVGVLGEAKCHNYPAPKHTTTATHKTTSTITHHTTKTACAPGVTATVTVTVKA